MAIASVAAVLSLLLAGAGYGAAQWLERRSAESAKSEADRSLTERFCQRLEADPGLLAQWRSAWELDQSVKEDMYELTATDESMLNLATVLSELAPRITVVAGNEPFDMHLPGGMGHSDILGAARYASHASATISGWDFSNTAYRQLGLSIDDSFSSTSFGSNMLFHEIEENCAVAPVD